MSNLYVTVHTGPSPASHGTTFRVDWRFDAVVEALLPDTAVPEPAWLDQARRNAELRARFIETHGALTAEQAADRYGPRGSSGGAGRLGARTVVRRHGLRPGHRSHTVPLDVIDDRASLVRPAEATVAHRCTTGAA